MKPPDAGLLAGGNYQLVIQVGGWEEEGRPETLSCCEHFGSSVLLFLSLRGKNIMRKENICLKDTNQSKLISTTWKVNM